MRIGKTYTTKVGHWVCFYPNHIIQYPIFQVLKNFSDTINIVIGADHPNRSGSFENPEAGFQPFFCELVVSGKFIKLIPRLIHGLHR